jgi:hypothetical protein
MRVFIRELEDGSVEEAPEIYKNISNFNKAPSLMIKFGFVERIKGYKKSDGTIKYIEPEKWGCHKTFYTETVQPSINHEWNSETESWQIKLEIAKEEKLLEIREESNSYLKELKKNFSDVEVQTWFRQENGLKLLSADINSEEYDAKWVKALAQTCGISLEEQMQRIAYSSNLMNEYAYRLVGYQQSLEDKINAATSINELEEIRFDITGSINS